MMPKHVTRVCGGYANSYIIEGPEGLVAVDVGTRLAAEMIGRLIAENHNGDRGVLKVITATHFHIDHVGGISRLKEICPVAEVVLSRLARPYVEGTEGLAVPPFTRWVGGLIPVVARIDHQLRNLYQGLASDKVGMPLPFFRRHGRPRFAARCGLDESGKVPFLPEWRIIETPGHTPDSVVFYHEESGSLISGDTILNMKGTGELNRFCCSARDIRRSFSTIQSLPVSFLLPGHGGTVKGREDLLGAVERF